jgi:2'-5' RNA ligase
MKKFSEYLFEMENKKDGTYSSLILTKNSASRLYSWVKIHDITPQIKKEDYHCTIVFSRKYLPDLDFGKIDWPIIAKIKAWRKFGDNLVLELESEKIHELNSIAVEAGATSDFDEYIPHITVSADFHGEVPEKLPKLKIYFNSVKIEEIDLDFKYEKAK